MRNRFLEEVLRQREAEQVAALSEAKGKALPRDPGGRPRFSTRPADEFARAQQAIQRGDVLAARASISRLERAKYLELARWCRAVGERFP